MNVWTIKLFWATELQLNCLNLHGPRSCAWSMHQPNHSEPWSYVVLSVVLPPNVYMYHRDVCVTLYLTTSVWHHLHVAPLGVSLGYSLYDLCYIYFRVYYVTASVFPIVCGIWLWKLLVLHVWPDLFTCVCCWLGENWLAEGALLVTSAAVRLTFARCHHKTVFVCELTLGTCLNVNFDRDNKSPGQMPFNCPERWCGKKWDKQGCHDKPQ